MKKSLRTLFIIIIIVLLISSFPVKHILEYPTTADLMRLIGFIMLMVYILYEKNENLKYRVVTRQVFDALLLFYNKTIQ